jgi:peroxiredoxin
VVRDFALADVRQKVHTAREWKGHKAVVLCYLGTECPVSNSYAPELARLAGAFAARGVRFYGVHPDPEVTAEEAARHAEEYRLPFPILLDPGQVVARQAGVRVVPEVVVLAPDGRVLYRGRVDDRYSREGKRRQEPRTRDLADALTAVLEGKPVPVPRTDAFGCPLPPSASPEPVKEQGK